MDIKKAIKKVVDGKDLTEPEAYSVFDGIMSGESTPSQIGAFITALRMKGEAVNEITGAAKVMRKKATNIRLKTSSKDILDTCGTGGTGTNTFNISTIVAFVLAAADVKVAKHGNRAVSGRCGSADVLEQLGVKLNVPTRTVAKCIDTINVGFLFAPAFHEAMRYASAPRKEIGMRTIFNILGPLCNPAMAQRQIIGVYDEKLTETIARVLKKLGSIRAYVVHGKGPLDEVTNTGKTRISELRNGRIKSYSIAPSSFGIRKASLLDIRGGSVKENAKIVLNVLSGQEGPKRNIVLMNASMAFMAMGKVKDVTSGVRMAKEAIDSGKAMEKLEDLIRVTNL